MLLRSAGVKTYLYHWLKAMQAIDPDAIRTFLAPYKMDRLDHGGGPLKHPAGIAAVVALSRLPTPFCDAAIPDCDVFHISNQLRRAPRKPRLTTTLHDLTAWILPECHTPAVVAADKQFAERILKRADGIIAVSENTKQDAIRILGLKPETIHVIHLGIPDEYFHVTPESVERMRKAYKLTKPYFLFVGTIEPRKNVDTLLTAWESMPDDFRSHYDLVIAGMAGWRSDATTKRLLQAMSDNQSVRYYGYVPENDMPALTGGAFAFVYPSLYEGFGIPVAQAMATGRPVIASNVSSLPEVAGEAALLVDPKSAGELAAAFVKMAESPGLAEQLGAIGAERARHYSWPRAAGLALRFFSGISGTA
ncbi:MAG TPA: glycosyltransferase family 1 protein [Bryobacteraceae bacterium]|jgi:alpha-1,3-rhamnosyl/mannosyltransferase